MIDKRERTRLVKKFLVEETAADCRDIRWLEDNRYSALVSCAWDVTHLKGHPALQNVVRVRHNGNAIKVEFDLPLELLVGREYSYGYICQQFYSGGRWQWQVTYLASTDATPVVIDAGKDKSSLESAQSACRIAVCVHREKTLK